MMYAISVDAKSVKLKLRSRDYLLDKPVVTATFEGTGGLEGTGNTSTKKRLVFGEPGYIPLVPVDANRLIYFLQANAADVRALAGTAPPYGDALLACGLAETIVASTSVAYNPVSAAFSSATIECFIDTIKHQMLGARGNVARDLHHAGLDRLVHRRAPVEQVSHDLLLGQSDLRGPRRLGFGCLVVGQQGDGQARLVEAVHGAHYPVRQ